MTSLSEWAVAEALRLAQKKPLDKAAAATAAARRAPGIKAAANVLKRLSLVDDDFLRKAIPPAIRAEVAHAEPSTDDAMTERVHRWLKSAPYELSRCNTAVAGLAAAAPVAVVKTQMIEEPVDEALEKAALAAIEQHIRRTRVRAREARLRAADAFGGFGPACPGDKRVRASHLRRASSDWRVW